MIPAPSLRVPSFDDPAAAGRLALAVADVNWFTTANLFGAINQPEVDTLLLHCQDYRNAWNHGLRPWHRPAGLRQVGARQWRRELVLPTGWMKRFPSWGMRPIRSTITRWRAAVAPDAPLSLVMTYPHYLYLKELVRPDHSVYFNLDDYRLYWPGSAAELRALEERAVRESSLTVCVARQRCEELRRWVPEFADRIRHLPHGTPDFALAERPRSVPAEPPPDLVHLKRPLLGFIGSLEDRIDWPLLTDLARAIPQASIVLIGRPAVLGASEWERDCRRCLDQPNVHQIGWRPQDQIGRYNDAFDVILVPYRTDHPFNIACCPTKIMDSMGSGRPMVVTDLPECRLYESLINVARTRAEFINTVQETLAARSDDGRAEQRWRFAAANTCEQVVGRLLSWMRP